MFRRFILGVFAIAIMLPASLAIGQDDCDVAVLAEEYDAALSEAVTLADLEAIQSQMGEEIAACNDVANSESSDPVGVGSEGMILNAAIQGGGVEVFPSPDRSSGRAFAAAGGFAPHIAGRSEDGNWLYIYYFDGGLQDGWAPAHQFADLTAGQVGALAVIGASNPPELPNLPYDELAARPFGTATSAGSDEELAAEDNVAANDEEQSAPTSPGSPPVIVDTFTEGSCNGITIRVDWEDPDGDAAEVVLNGGSLGRIAIDGSQGSVNFGGLVCPYGNACTFNTEVFDRAGNRSGPRSGTGWCN